MAHADRRGGRGAAPVDEGGDEDPAEVLEQGPDAEIRLNRYLALAGLGTRRSVERLARSGRIAIDGTPAGDPAQPVGPASEVTLDGHRLLARSPCGVLVRSAGAELPALPHPAVLHVAGRNAEQGLVVALDDERLAARLLERGYDPGHLIAGELGEGAFRPLSPAELTAADVYARRAVPRRPPTL